MRHFIIIGSLIAILVTGLFSCTQEKMVANKDWEISLLSAKIATDQHCMMSKMISGATPYSLNEFECRATIVTIKPKRLTPDVAETDFMKTKLIVDGVDTYTPYQVITMTDKETGEKEYELYFRQQAEATSFNLEFPDFPLMKVKIKKKDIKPLH